HVLFGKPVPTFPGHALWLLVARVENLEPGPALVGAGPGLAADRIDVTLAGLAQEARFDHQVALGRRLLATLLDEHATDRRLAGGRRKVGAGPAIGLIAVDHGEPQQMRHAPLVRAGARIGDEAQAADDATSIEQRRQDHGMAGDPGADLA